MLPTYRYRRNVYHFGVPQLTTGILYHVADNHLTARRLYHVAVLQLPAGMYITLVSHS
jgi:hypothetical protein